MIPRTTLVVAAAVASLASAQNAEPAKAEEPKAAPAAEAPAAAAPATDGDPMSGVRMDIISYMIAYNQGRQMGQQGVKPDVNSYMDGLKAGVAGDKAKFEEAQAQEAFSKFQTAMQAMDAKKGAAAVAEGKAYLEKNGKKEGVTTTASGLQWEVVKAAEGPKPKATDTVTVHYTGTLINGTKFDSSVDRGEPTSFPLNGVIKGWTEGLQLMSVGSKYKFTIPSELAYGENGPPSIGANQVLVFDVELIKIGQ
jgi:FKBP-type peptidyl-prolyl cis-trans isomerase